MDSRGFSSFPRDGQRSNPPAIAYLAVYDHDAYLVAGLMSFGIVKVANYMARPYLQSGQLIQVLTDWTAEQLPNFGDVSAKPSLLGKDAYLCRLGERSDSTRSNLPDALDSPTSTGNAAHWS